MTPHDALASRRHAVRVGTSGWRYRSWRGDFYPDGLVQRAELSYIGEQFSTVELNGSFYSLQRPQSYLRWRSAVPDDFVFAVKGSRYISHMLRLRDASTALANFFASGVLALGPTLGPILWQLPERQRFEPDVLETFLEGLPRTTREARALAERHDARMNGRAWLDHVDERPLQYALEPRSETFDDPALTEILNRHGVALTVADTAGRWPQFEPGDADLVYVRLHGASELYTSGYSAEELQTWADCCRRWAAAGDGRDVWVYFDNDARGHAPHDARALARLVGDAPTPR
ncbi:DUF72 domain-containing protein [Microbacterium esteraromaticum]|uniref:DUF72 domain-containing protein n=1 Tax=Microbacterium esteraromaticum TaxID=57043 RepID=UPI00195619E9|nr:DUF72 domain-containing protein [Microbacterium esteraromaticum]MBM7464661.1 uncharacterized protein YecE (DUF72 family) [Microbacterium esteraromaticum]